MVFGVRGAFHRSFPTEAEARFFYFEEEEEGRVHDLRPSLQSQPTQSTITPHTPRHRHRTTSGRINAPPPDPASSPQNIERTARASSVVTEWLSDIQSVSRHTNVAEPLEPRDIHMASPNEGDANGSDDWEGFSTLSSPETDKTHYIYIPQDTPSNHSSDMLVIESSESEAGGHHHPPVTPSPSRSAETSSSPPTGVTQFEPSVFDSESSRVSSRFRNFPAQVTPQRQHRPEERLTMGSVSTQIAHPVPETPLELSQCIYSQKVSRHPSADTAGPSTQSETVCECNHSICPCCRLKMRSSQTESQPSGALEDVSSPPANVEMQTQVIVPDGSENITPNRPVVDPRSPRMPGAYLR